MDIIFKNKDHEKNYQFILEHMKGKFITEQQQALAYLFALDENCFEHLLDLFDFYENEFLNICLTCSTSTKMNLSCRDCGNFITKVRKLPDLLSTFGTVGVRRGTSMSVMICLKIICRVFITRLATSSTARTAYITLKQ